MFGYHDRVAWIDLTKGCIEIRAIGKDDARKFIGGGMLGAAYLARMIGPDTDPLGPDNPLIYMTGPFTATSVPAGSRHEVVALSPLTGVYGESSCGGGFGRRLKLSRLDGLVFTGRSARPVALVIDGDDMTLRDAEDWWGMDVFETDDAVMAEFGKGTVCSTIGPAGENQVPLAAIAHDGRETRLAGRCGMGAVMGSKNLKAVVITKKGNTLQPLADAAGLDAATKVRTKSMRESLASFVQYGTPNSVLGGDRIGNLPINNWRDARAPELAEKIYGKTLAETIMVRRAGCLRCPFQCARVVKIDDGPYASDGIIEGPEYETLASFGSMQLVDDLPAISKVNELCNRLGLDSISAGAVVAFANECFEKGLLTTRDTEGLELGFDQQDANIELVRRIGTAQTDLGKLLGQGSRSAAQAIGGMAPEYSVEVKGLELPMHDPRFSWGHALSYATGNRGACHLTSVAHMFETGVNFPEAGFGEPMDPRQTEDKARFVYHLQNLMTMRDCLVFCLFTLISNAVKPAQLVEWLNLATGWHMDYAAFDQAGARGVALKRMINNWRGISRKDDLLPPRMRTHRKTGKDVDLGVPPLNPMLSDYYALRGWDEEGRPRGETVHMLKLTEFA